MRELETHEELETYGDITGALNEGYGVYVLNLSEFEEWDFLTAAPADNGEMIVFGNGEEELTSVDGFANLVLNSEDAQALVHDPEEYSAHDIFPSLEDAIEYMGEEPKGRRSISEEDKRLIRRLRELGYSNKQIAKKFRVSYATIVKKMKD